MAKKISGTREWATHNVNCIQGCSHDCVYCYAKTQAIRFKRRTPESWPEMLIDQKTVDKGWRKREGRIMFPTSHDITPETWESCVNILYKILEAGNEVLIVSKPHEAVIKHLCHQLSHWNPQVTFRFTIGAMTSHILHTWEPGAPDFWERYRALVYAHGQGYVTSVSMEPLLEVNRLGEMVMAFDPVVTDAIWIGKLNKMRQRVKANVRHISHDLHQEMERVEYHQSDEAIKTLYECFKRHPKIKWKESIKEVVGIPLATKVGEDK